MFGVDKKYWFYIFPFVYYCNKGKQTFLYNTLSGENIEMNNPVVLNLLRSLHKKNNLGALVCKGSMLNQNDVSEFISEFCKKKMGNIVDVEEMPEKPIQMMPILNLQCDLEKQRNYRAEILQNLLELNIYIAENCKQNCQHCSKYYKQMLCCRCSERSEILDISSLQNILSQIRFSVVGKINILGGTLFLYSDLLKLKEIFTDVKDRTHFYIHYKNFEKNEILYNFQTELIVNFPVNELILDRVLSEINRETTNLYFIIENEEQYILAEQFIENRNIEKYKIKPFFNGENIDFFKKNIFVNKEDIFSKPLTMREIFRNQKLNFNFFGILHIFSDGSVKANPNTETLGNIKDDKILDLIYKEMLDNTAWRKIRNIYPCNECLYQELCPSPSNYELIIGKSNLCHVQP